MLSKCANPACLAAFRYLSDGKVYRLEPGLVAQRRPWADEHKHNGDVLATISELQPTPPDLKKAARAPEYFWLCASCSGSMTLRVHRGSVVLVSSRPAAQKAAAS